MGDGEGASWEDYFRAPPRWRNMREVTALYTAATAAGYTLSEDDAATIDETIASLETAAGHLWLEGRRRLRQRHLRQGREAGHRAQADGARQHRQRLRRGPSTIPMSTAARSSPGTMTSTADVFDTLSFEYYLVSAERVETTETVTDEETGEETEETTEAVTDETMAEAKENAERILQAYESGAEQSALNFAEAITEVMGEEAGEPQRLHPHPGLLCQPVPERRARRLGARQRAPARRRDHHRERGQWLLRAVVFLRPQRQRRGHRLLPPHPHQGR